jgi:hypothetical protein
LTRAPNPQPLLSEILKWYEALDWVAPKALDAGALECPAEVWESIRNYPDSSTMIVERSNQVFELPGRELLKLVESEMLTLFPAAYRLVLRL